MSRQVNIFTIEPVKTTLTHTSNARSWTVKLSLLRRKVKLDFETWEQIFFGEFDGRRRKRVLVKIIGE